MLLISVNFNLSFAESKTDLDASYQSRIVTRRYKDDSLDDIFYRAKNNNHKTIDSNGNYVYEITDLLEVSRSSKNNEEFKSYVTTSFSKIEESDSSDIALLSSTEDKGKGAWDKTGSAYVYSRIYYTVSTNEKYVKLTKCTGSVSKLNSGVKLKNLTVRIAVTSPVVGSNQIVTKNYGTNKSFTYTPPSSWKSVPNNFTNDYTSSLVQNRMSVKLYRGTSTWTYNHYNEL